MAPSNIPFAPWPVCDEEQQDAACRVLRSGKLNYWTGEEGRSFEQEFASYVDCKHAITVANGTVGLELALAVLDIGPGDEVIVPSRTFIATASAVVMRGATPVCADVDCDSQNITVETIAAKLSPQTKAVIPVHLAGWPCDMQPILELAKEHNLFVIEDCAQAHGARYQGHHVGTLGDIGVFSFCQDKIMTTGGEGGMFVTNNSDLWNRAWSYRDHGKNYSAVHRNDHPPGFRWLHESFGTNWRMTEVQSAIGRVVLRKLPDWVKRRRQHAAQLDECFSQLPALRTPSPAADFFHSYYKFYAFVRSEWLKRGWDRDRIMATICTADVPCYNGSCSEIYLEKAFFETLRPSNRLANAKQLGETSLMFLVHPTLSLADLNRTVAVVNETMATATASLRSTPDRLAA